MFTQEQVIKLERVIQSLIDNNKVLQDKLTRRNKEIADLKFRLKEVTKEKDKLYKGELPNKLLTQQRQQA